eukprot:Em0002g839a
MPEETAGILQFLVSSGSSCEMKRRLAESQGAVSSLPGLDAGHRNPPAESAGQLASHCSQRTKRQEHHVESYPMINIKKDGDLPNS